MKQWAETKLAPALSEWFPKIIAELPVPGYTPPTRFSVRIGPGNGVAATSGTRVTANAAWFRGQLNGEAVGALIHEEVHVIQLYRPGGPRGGNAGGGSSGGARGGSADAQLTALETALGPTNKLNEAQRTKVKAALEDQSKKLADLAADDSVQGADRTAKRQAIRDETNNKIKDIVSAQQYAGWEQISQRGGRGRGGGGGGGIGGLPGWLVEAIPDYIRWFKFEPQSHGADDVWLERQARRNLPASFNSIRYDAPYRPGANFLNWVAVTYDKNIVAKLNAAAREGKYGDDIWKQNCAGKTPAELGVEWKVQLAKKFNVNWSPPTADSGINNSAPPAAAAATAAGAANTTTNK